MLVKVPVGLLDRPLIIRLSGPPSFDVTIFATMPSKPLTVVRSICVFLSDAFSLIDESFRLCPRI